VVAVIVFLCDYEWLNLPPDHNTHGSGTLHALDLFVSDWRRTATAPVILIEYLPGYGVLEMSFGGSPHGAGIERLVMPFA